MTLSQAQTLAALSSVGRAPVTIPLSVELFPEHSARECAAPHGEALSVDSEGKLHVDLTGDRAWSALRAFTSDLLAAALERE